MAHALIVIDAQQGFRNSHTEDVIPSIVSAVSETEDPVLFTRFINKPESNFERLLAYTKMRSGPAIEIVPELAPFVTVDRLFDKTGYSAFQSAQFSEALRRLAIDSFELLGFDTDACITATALEGFDLGFRPFVRANLCASSGGQQFHEKALELLERNLGEAAILRGRTIKRSSEPLRAPAGLSRYPR